MLAEYYRKRASEYGAFYADPERQADLAALRTWLMAQTQRRRVLEIAAGTGYWTAVAATAAVSITATDINAETLAIAARRQLGNHVTLVQADAWALPTLAGPFDLGMAHLWWSHLRKQDRTAFLCALSARLEPGARLLMIDENLVPNVGAPIVRCDAEGNTWQRRWLDSGERFEVVKNYPDTAELQQSVSDACERIEIQQRRYFWALSGRFRNGG